MFEVQILIPVESNENVPFPETVYRQWEEHLASEFHGFTRYPGTASGGWFDSEGEYYPDKTFVYGVALNSLEDGARFIESVRYARRLFEQKSMFIRYLNQAEIVE